MAEKESYPTIPAKQWWGLRAKFKQSIPPNVTQGYLAAALGMSEDSAKANVLPALIALKIIDQDGKPLDRAKRWRDDEQYASVCEEIRQEVYPSELVHALTPPSPSREAVERWIANRTGVGENAAGKMASLYLLLCEANPKAAQETSAPVKLSPKSNKPKSAPTAKPQKNADVSTSVPAESIPQHSQRTVTISKPVPSLHIDIQIHIASDSSNAQIDQIFASMAKHLGKLMNQDNE